MLLHSTSLPVFSFTRLKRICDWSFLSSRSRSNELSSIALYNLTGIVTNPKPMAPVQIDRIYFYLVKGILLHVVIGATFCKIICFSHIPFSCFIKTSLVFFIYQFKETTFFSLGRFILVKKFKISILEN